jgi:hypothetical protein
MLQWRRSKSLAGHGIICRRHRPEGNRGWKAKPPGMLPTHGVKIGLFYFLSINIRWLQVTHLKKGKFRFVGSRRAAPAPGPRGVASYLFDVTPSFLKNLSCVLRTIRSTESAGSARPDTPGGHGTSIDAADAKRQSCPEGPAAARIAFTLRPKPNIIQGKIA